MKLMITKLKEFFFGKSAKGYSIHEIPSGTHTTMPDKKLPYSEWQHQYRVGYSTPTSFNAIIVEKTNSLNH